MFIAFIKMMIALGIVVILLMATLRMTQKYANKAMPNKKIKLIEQLRLSPKSSVSVVSIGQSYFVLGSSEESVNLIKELTASEIETLNSLNMTSDVAFSGFKNQIIPPVNFNDIKDKWRK
ncbi:MAG: flagellar biosynthetic protein FliO [Turicibacter sp.]